jgi:ribosomal protein RSM22 (predicted rRNA methylase)
MLAGGQRPGPDRGPLGPSLRYNEQQTLAAAATQAAPGYAAALRVLQDIKISCPDFMPARVLDYGSGLGPASWAVQQVGLGASLCAQVAFMRL